MGKRSVRVAALAAATRRDVVRRPGALLGALGAAALVALLPRMAATAFDDRAVLPVELGVATLELLLVVGAGYGGILCAAVDSDLGPASELRSSTASAGELLAGRLVGLVQLAAVAALVLTFAFGVSYAYSAGGETWWGMLSGWSLAAVGTLAQAALAAALGLLLGAVAPTPLAAVLLLSYLAAARLALPGLEGASGVGSVIAAVVPDPWRPGIARDTAFGHPISPTSLIAAWGASLAHTGALVVLAAAAVTRRER